MEQTRPVPEAQASEEEQGTIQNIQPKRHGAHFQTTTPTSTPVRNYDLRRKIPALFSPLTAPTSPAHSPKSNSPYNLTPQSTITRPSALKKPSDPTSGLGLEASVVPSREAQEDSDQAERSTGLSGDVGGARRNVQFMSEDVLAQQIDDTNTYTPTRPDNSRTHSLYAKLKALTTSPSQGHTHASGSTWTSAKTADTRDADGYFTATPERNEGGLSATLEEDESELDADAEESNAEGVRSPSKDRKRRRKARQFWKVDSAPSSPLGPMHLNSALTTGSSNEFHNALQRSATETQVAMQDRQGISEDEGRSRAKQRTQWKPKHGLRGTSFNGMRKTGDTPESMERRRPLMKLNTLQAQSSREAPLNSADGETPRPSRRRMLTERGATWSAAKWKQFKASARFIGQAKKREKTADQVKSAELMAELAAGAPAALMLASAFQRDEHGNKRIPILLEQLKVKINESRVYQWKDPQNPTPQDRHIIFTVSLEYGNGINRMQWEVHKSIRDFAEMHAKYKLHFQGEKLKGRGDGSKKMPKFPKSAFPYLGAMKGLDDEEENPQENLLEADGAGTGTDTDRPAAKLKTRPSFGLTRRKSSVAGIRDPVDEEAEAKRNARYADRQRRLLEQYLQGMLKFLLFRADANRLLKFLEVSALGVRLAAEGSHHGKEGFLVIQSAKGLDFRKALTPALVKRRHTPKWFLVRHSYVVCVDSPEEMHIYDVFLIDSDFKVQSSSKQRVSEQIGPAELAVNAKESRGRPQHHRLKLTNSERKLKLVARNERQLLAFESSIRHCLRTSPWAKPNRYDSFAPVRTQCFAQWLVDGRDHMWVLSRALNQAKDVIYIHDWWLSPEVYLRRPPAISQKWRLDRVLKRKAEQGVKIFVIVYRNIESAIPIDSQYTKFSLLDLHPNVFVQRSPNQFRQGTFFWAHHEKICIVDHTTAFVGGIDLCFGRWDTPQHPIADDKPTGFEASELPKDADHCQMWAGKDYSNPRIQDFYSLNKPYEEMYDRQIVPRMPWHDIAMQVVGQPARDLTRHFVQRWNYILRQRKPTRPTPFLLPPPDFNTADLEALGLDGTCEVQILRSAGPWSIGTPDRVEHSIMTAYTKMIEESEYFVYIENQFFISSHESDGVRIYNKIGDALVERIIRAYKNDEAWRACIIIPLIPGFQNTVEQEGGTSVRLIMQSQYRSICRGESSIFGRLKANGIEPDDYIQFYALRQWGRIGPKRSLVTEQLYIHAKIMVVDDRVAIIGSANINERSMLGGRDSECAAIVRDTDMLESRMNGKPYMVGRFPHTLRMRLMREHLGLDTDKIMEDAQVWEAERRKQQQEPQQAGTFSPDQAEASDTVLSPIMSEIDNYGTGYTRDMERHQDLLDRNEHLHSFNHDVDWEQAGNPNTRANRKVTEDPRVTNKPEHRADVEGEGEDKMKEVEENGYGLSRDSIIGKEDNEVMFVGIDPEDHKALDAPRMNGEGQRMTSYIRKVETAHPPMPPRPSTERMNTAQLGLPMLSQLPPLPDVDDSDIGGPTIIPIEAQETRHAHPLAQELHRPLVDADCMKDPVLDAFYLDTWHAVAENNTKIYRAVFRCMPDSQVRNWDDYHQYLAYEHRFNEMQGYDQGQGAKTNDPAKQADSAQKSGPPGTGAVASAALNEIKATTKVAAIGEKTEELHGMIKGVLGRKSESEKVEANKAVLRAWAADANKAQAERRTRESRDQEKFPVLEEKSTIPALPELQANTGNDPRETPSPSTTLAEKPTPPPQYVGYSEALNMNTAPTRRRRRATTKGSKSQFNASDDIMTATEAEELLESVQGHLVSFPYDWLDKVEAGGNWLYPMDQISPIEIYV